MTPVTLSWLVIWFVILSVRTFWIAGSWIRGSTVATHRPVLDTSLPAHTPSTATGASTQPSTISTMANVARQLKCRRRRPPAPALPWSAAVSARSRSSSARSSWLSPESSAPGAG